MYSHYAQSYPPIFTAIVVRLIVFFTLSTAFLLTLKKYKIKIMCLHKLS